MFVGQWPRRLSFPQIWSNIVALSPWNWSGQVNDGMICSKCQRLLDKLPILEDDADVPVNGDVFGIDIAYLRSAAVDGCYICSAIWSDLSSKLSQGLGSSMDIDIEYQLHQESSTENQSSILEFSVDISRYSSPEIEHGNFETSRTFVLHGASGIFCFAPRTTKSTDQIQMWTVIWDTSVPAPLILPNHLPLLSHGSTTA